MKLHRFARWVPFSAILPSAVAIFAAATHMNIHFIINKRPDKTPEISVPALPHDACGTVSENASPQDLQRRRRWRRGLACRAEDSGGGSRSNPCNPATHVTIPAALAPFAAPKGPLINFN
jgi:hypothetical protein